MRIVIFAGPTLSAAEVPAELNASVLPPAAAGDVYNVARTQPDVIALIDGYFDRRPAVWHKEVLWALSQGIHVYGAASMGALRAAELSEFGMRGVGEIFAAFTRGELEDDDEVAITHAPQEHAYRAASEALVNIRATLANAEKHGVLNAEGVARLVSLAKAMHFSARSYSALFAAARAEGMGDAVLSAEGWVREHRIDQKRRDALSLVEELRGVQAQGLAPHRASFVFEHTQSWEELRCEVESRASSEQPRNLGTAAHYELLGAIERSGELPAARRAALCRLLALREASREGRVSTRESKREAVNRLRERLGLLEPTAVTQWLEQNRLTLADLERLAENEGTIEWLEGMLTPYLTEGVIDHLRLTGKYAALSAGLAPWAEQQEIDPTQ